MVTTRFAPSPTGELHIGGARTALFNWLLARKTGGTFRLRIEDTDQKRNVNGAIDRIKQDLEWLGLDWDMKVVKQSDRCSSYTSAARILFEEGLVYKKAGSDALYFSVPKDKTVAIYDTIAGNVIFNTNNFHDFVIMKENGFPTYNFACVIDDASMNITHVIRGKEHLNNCVSQQLIRDAIGITYCPIYSHVSTILNMDGSKMSKRDNTSNINVSDFRDSGINPKALINYIALLGWSPSGNKEIMTLDELIQLFDASRFKKSNSKFDYIKLKSFEKKHRRLYDNRL